MDPIRPKFTPPNIQQPREVAPAQSKAPAGKSFAVDSADTPSGAAGAQQAARPTYDVLASRIQDAVNRSLTREQVLGELVDSETKRLFGDNASPEMTHAVTQAFKNDPHLSALFNQLYNKATRQGG